MNIPIREEIPIKSFSICAYICKKANQQAKFLILKRCSAYLRDNWQMVSGKIEKNEKAWEAALREIKEETGIIPDELYSADMLEQFYEIGQNCINLVPIFVGFVENDAEVTLSSDEHDEYKWVSKQEAKQYLKFENQLKALEHIENRFIKNEPYQYLKIEINRDAEQPLSL